MAIFSQKIEFFRHVSLKEKALLTRALATMVDAGLPLVKALSLLEKQTTNKFLKEVLADVIEKLEEGNSLSSALSRHGDVFDRVYIASIQAAEASGKLEEILKDLFRQYEREYRLVSAIKGAVSYPVVVVLFMIAVAILLMVMVVPKFEVLFLEAETALPLATRALIALSRFISQFWYLLALIVLGAIIWLKYYFRTPAGRDFLSGLALKLPFVKQFFTDVYMSRFSQTLGMLSGAGVPIVESVKIVGAVMNNSILEKRLTDVSRQLERGVPMSTPLSRDPNFPPIVSQMIAVGEQTGALDEMMISLSGYFEEETSMKVKVFSSVIEPLLIILVGLGVGMIVFSIIVPIYQISQMVN